MSGLNMELRWENRLCKVNGKLGYFHICHPPSFGRTNALLMMQYFVNEFKRGENS